MVLESLAKKRLSDFNIRKTKYGISNAELSRRTGLSVNTVKKYINGETVRDGTVQKLTEALEFYVAEQTERKGKHAQEIVAAPQTIDELEYAAVACLTQAKEYLEKAANLRIDSDRTVRTSAVRKIQLQLDLIGRLVVDT